MHISTQSILSHNSFYECLRIRRHVYAYARPTVNSESEDTNPVHLEVSCVLHELSSVGFAQKRFAQTMDMLIAERCILEKLEEQSSTHSERIHQARLTNLTWLRKCAKEMGDDQKAALFANEMLAMKRAGQKSKEKQTQHLHSDSNTLQQKAMQCRLLARKFALEKADSEDKLLTSLEDSLEELVEEIRTASSGSSVEFDCDCNGCQVALKQAATQFRDTILLWVDKPGRRSHILGACDSLR